MKDMLALNAIGMGAYGLAQIFFGGVKSIARVIINGDLDPMMVQPKSLLLHLICSRSNSKGWGNLATTAFLIAIGQFTHPFELAVIALSMITGCFVFVAIGIIAHSLVFWLGAVESISKRYCDSLFLFALYPSNIYSGVLQILMFTLLPAGIIGFIPVELLRNFSWLDLFTLLASSAALFATASFVFHSGLKRYESGNQFGVRL